MPAMRRTLTLAALLAAGCSSASRRPAAPRTPAPAAVEVANQSAERIDVYLVAETQDRRLGRVEPGTRARLPLPRDAASLAGTMIRLAVIAGSAYTVGPSRDARAVLTLKQPLGDLARQEWVFAGGSLVPLPRAPSR